MKDTQRIIITLEDATKVVEDSKNTFIIKAQWTIKLVLTIHA